MVYDRDRAAVDSVCLNGVHENWILSPRPSALPPLMYSAKAACQSQQTRMEA